LYMNSSPDNSPGLNSSRWPFVRRALDVLLNRPPTAEPDSSTTLPSPPMNLDHLELCFRSFGRGQLVVGNLSDHRMFCWRENQSSLSLLPDSRFLMVLGAQKEESIREMVEREVNTKLIDLLRYTTDTTDPGLLVLYLSASERLRVDEYRIFHQHLKENYGVNSTGANLIKLYPVASDSESPKNVSTMVTRATSQNLDGGDQRVTIVNFSEMAYAYLSHFGESRGDRRVEAFIPPDLILKISKGKESENYFREKIRHMLRQGGGRRASIEATAEGQGSFLFLLPAVAEFQAAVQRVFAEETRSAQLDFNGSGAVFMFREPGC